MTAAALVWAFRVRFDAYAMVVKLKLPRSSPVNFVDGFYQMREALLFELRHVARLICRTSGAHRIEA